jgi:D-beta-D-heptose 7-phosphate kinase/D-beta-D-heptose 1-phosphate adenosyltransferase
MSGRVIFDRGELGRVRAGLRAEGRRLVFTNGCFDILHVGHVRYLEAARGLGDALLVAVNSDRSVRALKGRGRPLVAEAERAEMLAALAAVDFVTVFDEESPRALIGELLPDVLVKGGDYALDEIHGREEVEAAGGRVLALPFVEGASTTGIVERVRHLLVSDGRPAAGPSEPPIRVVPYDPRWPAMFEEDRRRIMEVVGAHVLAVEHIGSTSVPGLAAKPIIDVMVGLRSLEDAPLCVTPLHELGYVYVPRHEIIMPERRYFRRGPSGASTHHLHMVELGGDFWVEHLLFRDYLRARPEAARDYEDLKKRLADAHGPDRASYTDAKTDFIRSIVERARAERSGGAG